METACIAVTSGGREVRSRQNKLIENEALAEVQLAAFPWEFPPPLPPSLENERGTRVLRDPRGSLDERASKPLYDLPSEREACGSRMAERKSNVIRFARPRLDRARIA